MYFNRFDICEAYYCYMVEWHGGQWSKEYRLTGVFHNLKFEPGLSVANKGSDALEENAREIFDNLVANKGRNLRDRR